MLLEINRDPQLLKVAYQAPVIKVVLLARSPSLQKTPLKTSLKAPEIETKDTPVALGTPKNFTQSAQTLIPKNSPTSVDDNLDTSLMRTINALIKKALSAQTSSNPAEQVESEIAGQTDTELAYHLKYLKAEVQRYWKRPPNAHSDMEVILSVRLAPTGKILHAGILSGSGYADFDHSALEALKRVNRFQHMPSIPKSLYDRHFKQQLRLRFKPEDLE